MPQSIQAFYQTQDFINVAYALDIAIIEHFADMLFDGDKKRVIYSSNAYALRKRSDHNEGNLNLPFFNFRANQYQPGMRMHWNTRAYTQGVYIPEIGESVRFAPVKIGYEATFWCHQDYDLRYAFAEMVWDTDNKTLLFPEVEINQEQIPLTASLSYADLNFEPEYNEQDWLERNEIHSATMDFELEVFALKANSNVSLTEEIVLNFASEYAGYEGTSYDVALSYVESELRDV